MSVTERQGNVSQRIPGAYTGSGLCSGECSRYLVGSSGPQGIAPSVGLGLVSIFLEHWVGSHAKTSTVFCAKSTENTNILLHDHIFEIVAVYSVSCKSPGRDQSSREMNSFRRSNKDPSQPKVQRVLGKQRANT
jgi:hypothetical protein